jgi:hypothetical protein
MILINISYLESCIADVIFPFGIKERFEHRVFDAPCLSDCILLRCIVEGKDCQSHSRP